MKLRLAKKICKRPWNELAPRYRKQLMGGKSQTIATALRMCKKKQV